MNTETTPELLTPAPVVLHPVVRRAVALSIRQPWAWLIIHAGKDIENRNWPTHRRGRVLVHASKGMTRAEYEEAYDFVMCEVDSKIAMPTFESLKRGGVGYQSETSLRTQGEWLEWVERFSDEKTGREMREVKEAARATFQEPQYWTDFRKRYAETGDPWIRENANPPNGGTEAQPPNNPKR